MSPSPAERAEQSGAQRSPRRSVEMRVGPQTAPFGAAMGCAGVAADGRQRLLSVLCRVGTRRRLSRAAAQPLIAAQEVRGGLGEPLNKCCQS